MRPESAGHRRDQTIWSCLSQIPTVSGPSSAHAASWPHACSLAPHQSSSYGRTSKWEGEGVEGWEESMLEQEMREEGDEWAWMEESLISSWEDAALWCEIVWSCHLSQPSLKATLKPVMGLTSLSSHFFMSLFIFCFVTPPLLSLFHALYLIFFLLSLSLQTQL